MITVSSSLNLGMYLSPLVISASFRGLKRHITLTPHSDASIMSAAGTYRPYTQINKTKNSRKTVEGQSVSVGKFRKLDAQCPSSKPNTSGFPQLRHGRIGSSAALRPGEESRNPCTGLPLPRRHRHSLSEVDQYVMVCLTGGGKLGGCCRGVCERRARR